METGEKKLTYPAGGSPSGLREERLELGDELIDLVFCYPAPAARHVRPTDEVFFFSLVEGEKAREEGEGGFIGFRVRDGEECRSNWEEEEEEEGGKKFGLAATYI